MTLPEILPTSSNNHNQSTMSFEAVSLASNSTANINIVNNSQYYLRNINLPPMELPIAIPTEHLPSTVPSPFVPCERNLIEHSQNNTSQNLMNTPPTCENVMPGIHLARNFMGWSEDELRLRNFKHVIIIDKHVQEFFYPAKNLSNAQKVDQRQRHQSPRSSLMKLTRIGLSDPFEYDDDDCLADEDERNRDALNKDSAIAERGPLDFSKEFNVLNLNFGENKYLTTVLPNCYKAVRFISKVHQRQNNGEILVIDCNGSDQKCQTIIVAFLMYKHNLNFSNAFERLKLTYKNADLDRFYISQLYEYEPILKVQRAQSCGQSCSRRMLAATLKRKTDIYDDSGCIRNDSYINQNVPTSYGAQENGEITTNGTHSPHENLTCPPATLPSTLSRIKRVATTNTNISVSQQKYSELSTTANQLLSNLNPLRQFYPAQMELDE